VVSQRKDRSLEPADFHVRYDIWALFEGFKDIPDTIQDRLNCWELDHYIASHAKEVEEIRKTGTLDPLKILPRYLLLDETFEVLDQVDRVYLWPCNCRSMMGRCAKPVFTCLRFDNSQGQGYEISRERAKQIVVDANKHGLMQSGELGRDRSGKLEGAICNCCPDCCFPHLLAQDLKAEKLWPLSRYIAVRQEETCNFCGKCAKRCPFQAFVFDKSRENKQDRLAFDAALCRGCGLCAVTCPTDAITMEPVNRQNES
jgi:Pyruvate/2-oxoacid:ferredoxin oxidoreductase delta subunit